MLFQRFDFQPLVGEVLAGLILGPILLGLIILPEEGENPLEYFSTFGVLMLMLLAGLITDFKSFSENKFSSIIIGILGVITSFVLVFLPLYFLLELELIAALFIAAILSNTAIEVCASLLMDSKNIKIKSVVIGAGFVDDIIAVFLIGVVSSMAFAGTTPNALEITWLAIRVILFLVISLTVATYLLEKLFDRIHRKGEETKIMLTATLVLTFSFALIATQVGLHAVIGAYIAGLIIGKWGSKVGPMLKRRISREWLVEDIDPPLRAIFSPIFFGYIGLSMSMILSEGDFSLEEVLPLILVLGVLVFVGKIIGCGFGAKVLKFGNKESLTIGCAMCGRGALELVLLSFGLEIEAITEHQFISLVVVTLITIILTPILYTLALKYEKRGEGSG